MARSADATTPMPAVMTVDYVRIYKATAVPRPSMGTPASITVKAGATSGNTTTVDVRNKVGTGAYFVMHDHRSEGRLPGQHGRCVEPQNA
jgi:hypothetical protein